MIISICLDDSNGMLFNGRRQSRDRVLTEDLINSLREGNRLFLHPYSRSLFPEDDKRITADEGFLDKAGDNDICFVENKDITPWLDRIQGFIIYHWNRRYPADTYFTADISGFVKTSETEFKGSSHDRITKEVMVRC